MSSSASRSQLRSQGMQNSQRSWDNYSPRSDGGSSVLSRQRSWVSGGGGGSPRDQAEYEANKRNFESPLESARKSFMEASDRFADDSSRFEYEPNYRSSDEDAPARGSKRRSSSRTVASGLILPSGDDGVEVEDGGAQYELDPKTKEVVRVNRRSVDVRTGKYA